MTFIEKRAASQDSDTDLQVRHHTAADMHEKAAKHHRHAALLQDRGDPEQAQTHANIAWRHAVSSLTASERASLSGSTSMDARTQMDLL